MLIIPVFITLARGPIFRANYKDVDDLGLRPDQRDRLRRLVFNVRQKIELDPRSPRLLRTMHGMGYALYVDQKDATP